MIDVENRRIVVMDFQFMGMHTGYAVLAALPAAAFGADFMFGIPPVLNR